MEQTDIQDNAAIRQIREAYEKAVADAKAEREARAQLEAKLKEIETAALTEQQKKDAELEELKKFRAEQEAVKAAKEADDKILTEMYEAELAKVPEDKRETVKALSSHGTAGERFKALKAALDLIGVKTSFGTSTQPPAPGSVPTGDAKKPEPPKLDPKRPVPWVSDDGTGFFDRNRDKEILSKLKQ